MSDTPFLGEIQLFPFQFAPRNWAQCNGQLLPINQNQALFSLLGTTYGGDGVVTFALPDLRGRMPMGVSDAHPLGESTGAESVTLTINELPAHAHAVSVAGVTATGRFRNAAANQRSPVGNLPAIDGSNASRVFSTAAPDTNMYAGAVTVTPGATTGPAGGSQAHENKQPALTMNYCIAIAGVFPSRS